MSNETHRFDKHTGRGDMLEETRRERKLILSNETARIHFCDRYGESERDVGRNGMWNVT